MKEKFYTDNAAPCWSCRGTIAEYETDTATSLVNVRCKSCGRPDVFTVAAVYPFPASAAELSAVHRKQAK